MAERIEFTTPVGRIVAGDLFVPRTEDFQGNQLTVKTGANAGQARQEFFIALAIAKNDPMWPTMWNVIVNAARQGFPNLFDPQGNCIRQDFAFKVVDGDSQMVNRNNVRPCDKEGYPGHWVVSMATSIAPKVYDRNVKLIAAESKAIKRGDYVRVHLTLAPNGNAQNPGIFINPQMVQFSHAGDEITSGPDAGAVFGGNPISAAPAGAVTTVQPALGGMPTGTTTAPNPMAQASVATPPPPVQQNVQPAPDFLNPPVQPVAPVTPPVEQFQVNGAIYTRSQLRGWDWTDAQIDAQPRA
ncbi:MAG: DUF2815 family protein [Alistipes sp.]